MKLPARSAWTGGGNVAEPRQQFTFYRSYYDAIQELPKEEQASIVLAVCAYAIYETEPQGLTPAASMAFKLIRPTLDSGRKKAENGKKGGSKTKANGKQNKSKRENEYENDIEYENEVEVDADDLAQDAESRRLERLGGELGNNVVLLSKKQIAALLDKMGIDAFDYYVDRLKNYIIDTGRKPTNHYSTILKWWTEDSQV